MGELLRFEVGDGHVLVEERGGEGLERVGLRDRIRPAGQSLASALAQIAPAAQAAFDAIGGLTGTPERMELELGITLTAEVGAVIARSTTEGHLIVRMAWPLPPRAARTESLRASED
jgi:hypothetical protein